MAEHDASAREEAARVAEIRIERSGDGTYRAKFEGDLFIEPSLDRLMDILKGAMHRAFANGDSPGMHPAIDDPALAKDLAYTLRKSRELYERLAR